MIKKAGKFGKTKSTINFGDPESRAIVIFEKNPLYKKYHLISIYPISRKGFNQFVKTGNIGLSPEERKKLINNIQVEKKC